jgi:hypothetical protein
MGRTSGPEEKRDCMQGDFPAREKVEGVAARKSGKNGPGGRMGEKDSRLFREPGAGLSNRAFRPCCAA